MEGIAMRLVAWNVNDNCMHRPLEDTVRLLEPLSADILVLSETAAPGPGNPLGAHWIGNGAPGLAVVARTGLDLTPDSANAAAPPLMGAFRVSGRVAFDLLAVWSVLRPGWQAYHAILMAGLNRYGPMLGSGRSIMAGDFNSSTAVLNQRQTHPIFVRDAGALGLVSAYHEQTREEHGEETVPTFLQHGPEGIRPFHIDYCFVPRGLTGSTKIDIGNRPPWERLSDHFPLILDVCDEALMGATP